MGTFKKAKVILLPTGFIARRNEIGLQAYKTNLRIINNTEEENLIFNQQHLYIISDDKIKGGDWFYNIHSKIVGRAAFNFGKDELAKKIIATTDKSLEISNNLDYNQLLPNRKDFRFYLPQPSEQFIQKFIEEYNRGNVITDVLVEYNDTSKNEFPAFGSPVWLKINSKDNTITIKKVKDSYTREEVDRLLDEQASKTTAEMLEKFKEYKSKEEVEKLCKEAYIQGQNYDAPDQCIMSDKISIEEFIRQNL